MVLQLKRILIPVIILLILLATGQSKSAGQTLTLNSFLPLIVQNRSGWIGPDGGTIVALAIDPSNPQTVYAGSYGSGVFKSLDGGTTWQAASQGLTNLYIYSLAIDPTHPATVYAGTYRSQVYKSEDGGKTWHWSGNGMQASA